MYGNKETLWSQTITSNLDLQSVNSNLFITQIDNSKTNLIISYNINSSKSETIHEIIKLKNKNGEVKDINVTLRIYNIGGHVPIIPIPIPEALSGLLSWFFPIEDGEIIGIYYLTLIIVFGFLCMVILFYYVKGRQWVHSMKNFSKQFER